jgi:hypothetical protein
MLELPHRMFLQRRKQHGAKLRGDFLSPLLHFQIN